MRWNPFRRRPVAPSTQSVTRPMDDRRSSSDVHNAQVRAVPPAAIPAPVHSGAPSGYTTPNTPGPRSETRGPTAATATRYRSRLFDFFQDDRHPDRPTSYEIDIDVLDLSDDGRLAVVGESHYQQALTIVSNGRAAGDTFDTHLPVVALLVPEPGNVFDRNAVRIDIISGSRSLKVGYLAREVARHYQPALLELQKQNRVGRCPARITGGGPYKYYGVYLHVASPERLFAPADTGPEVSFASISTTAIRLNADWSCTVTKEEEHQDVLARYADSYSNAERPGEFVLEFGTATKGKYRGERVVEVRIGPDRVGELTMAMTTRYAKLIEVVHDRGAVALSHGHIEREERRGYQVVLHMPRDPARPRRPEWYYA